MIYCRDMACGNTAQDMTDLFQDRRKLAANCCKREFACSKTQKNDHPCHSNRWHI